MTIEGLHQRLSAVEEIRNQFPFEFSRLEEGIGDREDPVTWRTMGTTLRKFLGSKNPEWEPAPPERFEDACLLVDSLVNTTHLEPLKGEILAALGYKDRLERWPHTHLDALLINARHLTEPLLYDTADQLKGEGGKVAVFNPVGHYNDYEARLMGLNGDLLDVDHAVFIASTQVQRGGSVDVLLNTLRLLRNPRFTRNIRNVDIVLPMIGGSRGDKISQDEDLGYEVLELKANSKKLTSTIGELLRNTDEEMQLVTGWDEELKGTEEEKEKERRSRVTFYTVGVHNPEFMQLIFTEGGFKFVDIDPSPVFAPKAVEYIEKNGLTHLPWIIEACDKSSACRATSFMQEFLPRMKPYTGEAYIAYVDKIRETAGEIKEVRYKGIEKFTLHENGWIHRSGMMKQFNYDMPCGLMPVDDMLDTGGTARNDLALFKNIFNQCRSTVYVGYHPVLSSGLDALDKVGADTYIFGNTLRYNEVWERPDVIKADVSPVIVEALGLQD